MTSAIKRFLWILHARMHLTSIKFDEWTVKLHLCTKNGGEANNIPWPPLEKVLTRWPHASTVCGHNSCLQTQHIHWLKCSNSVRHFYKLLLLRPFTRPDINNFTFLRLLLLQVLLHPLTNAYLGLRHRLKHQNTTVFTVILQCGQVLYIRYCVWLYRLSTKNLNILTPVLLT